MESSINYVDRFMHRGTVKFFARLFWIYFGQDAKDDPWFWSTVGAYWPFLLAWPYWVAIVTFPLGFMEIFDFGITVNLSKNTLTFKDILVHVNLINLSYVDNSGTHFTVHIVYGWPLTICIKYNTLFVECFSEKETWYIYLVQQK